MASFHVNPSMNFTLLFCCLLVLVLINISPSVAETTPPFPPKTISLPVKKILQFPKNQYIISIKQRTPLISTKLAIDTGVQVTAINCNPGYVSSTYKPVPCGSPQCFFAVGFKDTQDCQKSCYGGTLNTPGCNNNTCLARVQTPFSSVGELSQDVASFESMDGKVSHLPNLFFACANKDEWRRIRQDVAAGVKGVAALAATELALPSQFAAAFGLDKKFAVCLSSKTRSPGVILFGKIDVSKSLTYTPLVSRPNATNGRVYGDYFLGLKTIRVNGKVVPFDSEFLGFHHPERSGGTRVSTFFAYTGMESSILSAFVDSFVKAMPKHVPRVADVSPFKACFNSTYIAQTRSGPAVPTVDFVMENGAVWRMLGANTMEQVAQDVVCLAFIDRWDYFDAETAIIIGGRQLEDNLLEFDITNKRFGFGSKQTSCFKFAAKYK